MGGKLDDLSELSRNLSVPLNHPQPEQYIRKTLLAHGFFSHTHQKKCSQALTTKEQNVHGASKEKLQAGGISDLDKARTTQLVSQIREGKEVHSLKEPRNLFAKLPTREPETKLPLWPSELECVSGLPHFLATPPPSREPFYHNDHDIVSPKIRSGEGGGTLVYTYQTTKHKYFTNSRAGPSMAPPQTTPTRASANTTLVFESRFESGNLGRAIQVGKWDYELYLRFDHYTNKHTQWFYFCVRNVRAGQTYRFTIVNLYKAGSLYNNGMQPVMYSSMRAEREGLGWGRAGHAIKYFKTNIRRQDTKQEAYYYALTWSHTFSYSNDTVYFAHCYPYTYSDLQHYLSGIEKDQSKCHFVKQRTLCHTIAGNPVPILTITSKVQSPEENRTKKVVVVTSRVHPGETNGSWMMKGLLDFLISNSPDAKILRDMFIFKVIPMLNPDGVIIGNYRCSLAGRDLNRNYRSKLKDSYPTVWHTKAMVRKISESNDVILYCDLHGHSRKHNIFIYGCDQMDDPLTRLRSRVFPKMLSKNAPHLFSYKDSKFGVHKSKEGTGRVVMWREMGITNSYTMEATFCGSLLGRMAGYQFSTTDLEAMGYHFCDTLLDYCDPDQSKVERILHELEDEYRIAVLARLVSLGHDPPPPGVDPLDLPLADIDIDLDSSDGGSDSSISDGLPVHLLAKEARKKRKKKLKSRRERNKKKALLKMTHAMSKATVTPTQPPMMPSAFITQQSQPMVVSYHHHHDNGSSVGHVPAVINQRSVGEFSYIPNEVARNGGIPVFIQERLDERQKRRSDIESGERLSDEYTALATEHVEAVTVEYVRQGFPPTLAEVDPRTSTSLLPRPLHAGGFPMSITPIPLWEGRGQSHPPSRLSSKTTLPQLVSSHLSAHGSMVPFASQYLAHHLQEDSTHQLPVTINSHDDVTGGQPTTAMTMVGAQNSTKNLANLSRLFRQLRPHLIQSVSSHMKSSKKQIASSFQSETSSSVREVGGDGGRGLLQNPSRVHTNAVAAVKSDVSPSNVLGLPEPPLQVGGASRSVGPTHSQTILMKHLHNQLTVKRSEVVRSNEQLSSSEKISPSHSQIADPSKKDVTNQKSRPTRHDRKALVDVYPSNSMLGSLKGSPLTSSWESFTRPVKLTERHRDEEEEAGPEREEGQKDAHLEKARNNQDSHILIVPGQSSVTRTRSDGSPSGAEIETHKQRIAKAVDSVREQRQRNHHKEKGRDKTKRASKEVIENNEKSSVVHPSPYPPIIGPHPPTTTVQKEHTADTTAAKFNEVQGSRDEGASSRNKGGSSRDVGVSSSDEEMRVRLEALEVDIAREQSAQSSSSSRKTVPVSTSFIYSTKPPSLYGGPKPSPECSSRPTTVSLMLSRGRRDSASSGHTHGHSAVSARPRTQGKYNSNSHTNNKKRKAHN